jgi:membrane-associated HD superfamily phosphohydrolase
VLTAIYYLLGLGIVISSSRLGIVFLLIEIFLGQIKPWREFLGGIARLRIARSKLRALVPSLLLLVFIALLGSGAMVLINTNPVLALSFLNGTGVSDTASHSVIERENAFEETVQVILQHPWVGRSLGGISAAIADNEGDRIRSFEDAKTVEGMSVFAEVLAASGVIGFIPFVCFVVVTIWKPIRVARVAPRFYSVVLHGFVRSLIFAWAILQFNQNILRPYLWTHLALLATVYAASLRAASVEGGQVADE